MIGLCNKDICILNDFLFILRVALIKKSIVGCFSVHDLKVIYVKCVVES